MLMPHLQYSILNWGHKNSRLHKLQKRAVRIMTNSKYNAHTEPLFKSLNLLKLPDIYRISILKLYYKYENDSIPDYFKTTNFISKPEHSYPTSQRDSLRIPLMHSTSNQHSLRYMISKYIRSSPNHILQKVQTHSLKGFAWYIKQITIKEYETECRTQNCFICNRT